MSTRKLFATQTVIAAAALAFVLALVPVALAGKGKTGAAGGPASPSSTVSVSLFADVNGNGLLNWGDAVTVSASTTVTSSPSVKLTCYQGGSAVLWGQGNFYLGTTAFPLQSGIWTGGAADCTAVLYYMSGDKRVTLATSDFHVDA